MDKVIHIKSQLQCKPQRAFEMFTVNRHIVRWLAPKADVKPEVGGRYHIYWDKDDPEKNSSHGCVITAIEHGRFLSFNWNSFPQFEEFMTDADPKTHCVVFFMPVPDSPETTDVHLIHSGWKGSPNWDDARLWYESAWKKSFKNLEWQING
ncbi:MAG: SRPBCC domain-containing protein [Candidatus Marinimicrobia bacterium]|nr:SRPBCC domain-containing protein [Candidatus Neomarinimicrobiota bacterium]MCF7828366.1 SRPBCC domain-containing protein [Candidatus Neomarinimicrobiota bacterium]MCF7881041.1 SRPBCC domain-containing protein [Candidatus Neomarinimicrobiota bacterium]